MISLLLALGALGAVDYPIQYAIVGPNVPPLADVFPELVSRDLRSILVFERRSDPGLTFVRIDASLALPRLRWVEGRVWVEGQHGLWIRPGQGYVRRALRDGWEVEIGWPARGRRRGLGTVVPAPQWLLLELQPGGGDWNLVSYGLGGLELDRISSRDIPRPLQEWSRGVAVLLAVVIIVAAGARWLWRWLWVEA